MSLNKLTPEEKEILDNLYGLFKISQNYSNDVRLMKVYRFATLVSHERYLACIKNLEHTLHQYRHEDTFEKVYKVVSAVIDSHYDTAEALPKIIRRYVDY